MRSRPKFISFFSGARGLDIGLEQAGWECLAANEFDKAACDTIRSNAPQLRLYQGDIRELTAAQLRSDLGLDDNKLFAVVGGPPCQAFSTAGKRLGLNDQRGNVFLHFLDLIGGLRPKYAIFENVRGLLSAPLEHRPHDQRGPGFPKLKRSETPGGALAFILDRLKSFGYATTFTLYNTANFGVPQARERIIFFASRDGREVPFMEPTHGQQAIGGLRKWVTLREAIGDIDKNAQHYASFPESRLRYYRLLSAGQNWRNLPEEVQQEAMAGSWYAGGGKTGFYRRLAWTKPSPTLVTRPNMKATDLCHPSELRPLSVEEYAAIQTFPSGIKFAGNLDDQYRQIGNAVPCKFGEAIGKHLTAFDEGRLAAELVVKKTSRYSKTDHASWEKCFVDSGGQLSIDYADSSVPLEAAS
jgi:DNA (cytosine-5)-methyltransferase 1